MFKNTWREDVTKMEPGFFFQWCPVPGQEGSVHKLEYQSFPLNIKKNFFTVQVIDHWNWLPKEIVEFRSLEIF